MAKSKRRIPSGTGPSRAESPRRSFRPSTAPPPPPQRPPSGGPRPVGTPRPLVPERQRKGPGWLGMLGPHRLIIALSALAVLAAVGLVLFAWYDQNIKPRHKLAVQVGNRSYDMDYWARRLKMAYEDPANTSDAQESFTTAFAQKNSDQIAKDAALLQRAGTLGVTATSNEIDTEMLLKNNLPVITDTPEGQEPGPDDPLRVGPGDLNPLRGLLQRFGLTLGQFREIYHASVLNSKVDKQFIDQQPTRGPQARVRLLQLPSESDARIAMQKINSGESTFTQLADTVSLDPAGKGVGGERDWLPHGILPPPLDNAAFSLPLNTLSDPIDSGLTNGWFLMIVEDRQDQRDISEAVRKQLGQKAAKGWLDQQLTDLGYKNKVTPADATWADGFLNIRGAAGLGGLTGLPPGTSPVTPLTPPLPGQPQTAPAAPNAVPPAQPAAPPAAPAPPSSP